MIPALVACFYVGIMTGWWLHAHFSRAPAVSQVPVLDARATGTAGADGARKTPDEPQPRDDVPVVGPALAAHDSKSTLRVPIDGLDIDTLKGSFAETRGGGVRPHEAVDILAPRNTPVHAVTDGTIAKLFHSKAGGITVYEFDDDQRYCYYYAHLERYADGLHEGQRVSAGDVIGYVGTSGNAPKNTPHLHLAVFELTPEHRWWDGKAIDPYLAFKQ